MCPQFDLEVMCKRPKKVRRASNFHLFLSRDVHSKEHLKRIKLWCLNQCFFYWWNIAKWRFFFSKMLILAIFFQKLIFLSPNFSSNMTIFHPFWQIFIKLWWFHPKCGRKCCTFYFIGATCSINENLQNKHWFECNNLLVPMEWGAAIFWGWSATR
jgi:hypothetical protein